MWRVENVRNLISRETTNLLEKLYATVNQTGFDKCNHSQGESTTYFPQPSVFTNHGLSFHIRFQEHNSHSLRVLYSIWCLWFIYNI
jgi:hypothetical protein